MLPLARAVKAGWSLTPGAKSEVGYYIKKYMCTKKTGRIIRPVLNLC
jgi:hypothetical protein